MNPAARAVVTAVAACLAVPMYGVPAALAASATEPAASAGYFYSVGLSKPDESPAAPPNLTADADGVAPGNLAVAARAGQEDKVSFLLFPLSQAGPGATLSKALLTVPTVPMDSDNTVIAPDPAKVRACKAGDSGFGGEDGASLTLAPTRLCDEFMAPGKASADGKSYVFDITGLAATWDDANDGVALTAADGAQSTTFQVVFAAAPEVKLSDEYTAAAPAAPAAGLPPSPDAGPPEVSGGADTTDLSGGFDSGSSAPVDTGSTGGFGAVESPVVDTALPPAEAPAVVGPAPAVAGNGVVNVGSRAASAPLSSRPSVSFVLGSLLAAALLALLSLILGDHEAAPTAVQQSRLGQALQARQPGRHRRLGSALGS